MRSSLASPCWWAAAQRAWWAHGSACGPGRCATSHGWGGHPPGCAGDGRSTRGGGRGATPRPSDGSLAAQPPRVVAGRHQQLPGGVQANAGPGQQRWCGRAAHLVSSTSGASRSAAGGASAPPRGRCPGSDQVTRPTGRAWVAPPTGRQLKRTAHGREAAGSDQPAEAHPPNHHRKNLLHHLKRRSRRTPDGGRARIATLAGCTASPAIGRTSRACPADGASRSASVVALEPSVWAWTACRTTRAQ
jgi:hypothetical protein